MQRLVRNSINNQKYPKLESRLVIINNHDSLSGGIHEGVGTDYGKSGGNVFETDTKMPSCESEEVKFEQGESLLHESEMAQEVLLGKQNKGNLFREGLK